MSHIPVDDPAVAIAKRKLAEGKLTQEEYDIIVGTHTKANLSGMGTQVQAKAAPAEDGAVRASGAYGFGGADAATAVPTKQQNRTSGIRTAIPSGATDFLKGTFETEALEEADEK